ncbi:MAG TPA: hypothetical protein VF316_10385 [Polyangiaceae bacterium]
MRRTRGAVRWLFAGALAAAGAAVACSSLLGIDTLTNLPDDGGPEGAADAAVDAPQPTCTPAHPAPRPDAQAADGGTEFTVAIDHIFMGLELSAGKDLFYDLDNVCTCTIPNAESCRRPAPDGGGPDPQTCDLADGRDGTGNQALGILSTLVAGMKEGDLQAQLDHGRFGAVVTIGDYDGTPNDSQVRVDVVRSYGTKAPSSPTYYDPLRRDGTDMWTIDPAAGSNVGDRVTGTAHDGQAYVVDGVVVAHFPVLPMVFQYWISTRNPISMRLVEVTVSAKLVASDAGGPYALTDGKVAGRWRAADAVRSFSVWTDPFDVTNGICAGTATYDLIVSKMCPLRDLRGAIAEDGKLLSCDAFSFGVGFTAVPAHVFGTVGFNYQPTNGCFSGTPTLAPELGDPCVGPVDAGKD